MTTHIRAHMDRSPPLRTLVTQDLGYCCPWMFFTLFTSAQLVADRLGCTRQAVTNWQRACREGDLKCEKMKECLKIKLAKKPIHQSGQKI